VLARSLFLALAAAAAALSLAGGGLVASGSGLSGISGLSLGRAGLEKVVLVVLFIFREGEVPGLEDDGRGLRRLRDSRGLLPFLPLDPLFGTVHAGRGNDLDLDVELLFDPRQLLPVVVLEGVGQLGMETDLHPLDGAAGGAGLDAPQNRQAHHLLARQPPRAVAGRATAVRAELERLLDALPVDLQQAVGADAPDGGPRLVRLEGVLDGLLDPALVLRGPHV